MEAGDWLSRSLKGRADSRRKMSGFWLESEVSGHFLRLYQFCCFFFLNKWVIKTFTWNSNYRHFHNKDLLLEYWWYVQIILFTSNNQKFNFCSVILIKFKFVEYSIHLYSKVVGPNVKTWCFDEWGWILLTIPQKNSTWLLVGDL